MKIVLCTSRDFLRERWRSFLQQHNYSVYQASSLDTLESVVHKDEQNLMLVDQQFMDIQTIGTFCSKPDNYKLFIFADSPDPMEGVRLMQIGVVGYANTHISEGRLVEAVKTVAAGRVWFSQDVVAFFIKAVPGQTEEAKGALLAGLSEREREIALLVAQGLTNNEIAAKLYISEKTVKAHLGTIFSKTGAASRLKLALMIRG
jgi:DNA-binding NarL/FixJ family response regulator